MRQRTHVLVTSIKRKPESKKSHLFLLLVANIAPSSTARSPGSVLAPSSDALCSLVASANRYIFAQPYTIVQPSGLAHRILKKKGKVIFIFVRENSLSFPVVSTLWRWLPCGSLAWMEIDLKTGPRRPHSLPIDQKTLDPPNIDRPGQPPWPVAHPGAPWRALGAPHRSGRRSWRCRSQHRSFGPP